MGTSQQIFSEIGRRDHEQVVFCHDAASGLRAIIAIHNTVIGPSLGGCRMYPYASEQEALVDVLRLSEGMTYKAAIAGLNLGGGKAVVIGDPKKDKSELLWRALGRFIEGLGGRYITAEDSGTTIDDMDYIRMESRYVVGLSQSIGGAGDPSPVTARGVFAGLRAALAEERGSPDLKGVRVAVQGCGAVGYHLVGHLVESGAKVWVSDLDKGAVARTVEAFGAQPVEPDAIYDQPCDVFAPCAMGGILNPQTIPRLQCKVVAGGANNQLADQARDGAALIERGIVYAPDYVVNAAGVINVAAELENTYNRERVLERADGIFDVVTRVFAKARDNRVAPFVAANQLAQERIDAISRLRRTCTGLNTSRR